uniref:ATP synthase complex subunit 8 n=1 Tax=Tor tor TaxID=464755 RepID=A0A5C0QFV3_TORTZ|nr:ATPase synthase subunit 8 [Tor tor]
MPQFPRTPWLAKKKFSWLIFLTIIPTKILNHISPNEPTPVSAEKHKTESWDWPW